MLPPTHPRESPRREEIQKKEEASKKEEATKKDDPTNTLPASDIITNF